MIMEHLRFPKRIVSVHEPILAEESTFTVQALSLTAVIEQLQKIKNAAHHDYLMGLILVLLAESGFHVSSNSNTLERDRNTRLVHIPKNWKSSEHVYEICFVLHNLRNSESKLIARPIGDKLILNMFSIKTDEVNNGINYSMAVQTLLYVNRFSSSSCGLYMNLKEISQRFKNTIANPLRTNILMAMNLKSPSLQGLPIELKFKILDMLRRREIVQLSQCSREFSQLCSDPHIQQTLLLRELRKKEDHSRQWRPCSRFARLALENKRSQKRSQMCGEDRKPQITGYKSPCGRILWTCRHSDSDYIDSDYIPRDPLMDSTSADTSMEL